MKELQNISQEKMEVQAPVKKELKLLGTLKPHNGHKCFQFDTKTGEITLAEFSEVSIDYTQSKTGEHSVIKKLLVKDGCLYVTALNMKNAKRRFEKMVDYLITNN